MEANSNKDNKNLNDIDELYEKAENEDSDNDDNNDTKNDNLEKSISQDSDSESEKEQKPQIIRQSYMPRFRRMLSSKLEKIHENDEDNYSTNKETKDNIDDMDPQDLIANLRNKIKELEDQIINLRLKNDELTRSNIQNDSKMRKMSFVGIKRKFTFGSGNKGVDSVKLAELLKEKSDLQEINEKMLNMLTDKELENDELQENFDKYKSEMKMEIQKYIDTIEELEDKIDVMEETNLKNQNFDNNLDEIVKEYNKYKERMENKINEHIKKEEELKTEIEDKEGTIQNMKNEIQNLELDNIQLKNQSEQNEKAHDAELVSIDKIMYENEKLKSENFMLQDKLKSNDEKSQMIIKSKDEEINTLNEDIEFNKKNTSKKIEEKNKEINLLKDEVIKCNRDINNLIKKNDVFEREDRELKEKNEILQNKLDKKSKELQEINDSAKKLIENKENLIKEYGDKIDELMADKNQLIEQNHELLDKVKNMNTNNLGDILGEEEENENNDSNGNNNYENILLTSEIKALKEQLENQANDLVSLNAMEKEVSRLKSENEKLEADYKALKDQIKKNKYDTSNDNFMIYVKKQYENLRMSRKKRVSFSGLKEIPFANKTQLEKQIDTLKQIKEDEKKNYVEEIDKLKSDIAVWKVKCLNQELENETLLVKYKNRIKSVYDICTKKGIKFNLNLNEL